MEQQNGRADKRRDSWDLKKQKTDSKGTNKGRREQGEVFYWMKAHLFWHPVLPASSNLDTFKYIDLILICSVHSRTHIYRLCSTHTHSNCSMWLKGRGITLARYREAVNQWRRVYRLFLPSQGTDPTLKVLVHCVCVCVVGWGVNYRTTAGGRGLASGLPSPERPGRPKTFSGLWSPICNGKPSDNGRQKGNANEAARG